MSSSPEAFALLVLADATLSSGTSLEAGYLALECVTINHPGGDSLGPGQNRDVYLVLRVNSTETPLDPDRPVHRQDSPGYRNYVFRGIPSDPADLTVSFKLPPAGANPAYLEDLDTFENIIGQYHSEFNGVAETTPYPADTKNRGGNVAIGGTKLNEKDLRGHLVMVDERTGEFVGQVEDRFRIQEDPTMHTRGHENDPVVIEVREETLEESDANAMVAFARAVPPDQANWIINTATVVSSAISLTTNLVVTTITAASNFYINHSKPSPHHSGASTPIGENPPVLNKDGTPRAPGAPPLPPRPRALVFLTSETTKKNLNRVHAVSGEAVKVSAKTVGFIDGMIRRAMGAKPKRERGAYLRAGASNSGQDTPVAPSPLSPSHSYSSDSKSSAGLAPPSYGSPRPGSPGPSLPPRRATSPAPPPLPPREGSARTLSTKARILISADLILSTIDHSTRQVLDASTTQVGKVMTHKYGEEAGESSLLMANTARNVGLVYVDLKGIGRRALLKRAGRTWVKARLSSNADPQAAATPVPKEAPVYK